MHSYSINNKKVDDENKLKQMSLYQEGDFVIRFFECDAAGNRDCSKEMEPFYMKWEKEVEALGGVKQALKQ